MVTICMYCQILFSGENKKNITTLSPAELAKGLVKVNYRIRVVADSSVGRSSERIMNTGVPGTFLSPCDIWWPVKRSTFGVAGSKGDIIFGSAGFRVGLPAVGWLPFLHLTSSVSYTPTVRYDGILTCPGLGSKRLMAQCESAAKIKTCIMRTFGVA